MITLKIDVPAYELVYEKAHLRRVLRSAGAEVAAVAKQMILRSAGSGRQYRGSGGGKSYRGYRKGPYIASAPGQAPVSVTGTLARSLVVRPFRSGEGVAIRDLMFYATILEGGFAAGGRSAGKSSSMRKARAAGSRQRRLSATRSMQPRPFLTAALAAREKSIGERVKAAVLEGIKFQRLKAAA
ncbi:MAG TPA: hypothetical protein VNE67_08985 [Acetobacteraceae bacterium]|nr:hypothetical protein [Acetobacteraceae bacterium]